MSAVDHPNKNFDNEKQTHTPYSEIVRGNLQSSYEKFRSKKNLHAPTKKTRKQVSIEDMPRVDLTAYKKWFKQ